MIFSRPQQYKMAKYCDEIFGELLLKVQSTNHSLLSHSLKTLWFRVWRNFSFKRYCNSVFRYENCVSVFEWIVFQEPLPDFPLDPGQALPPPSRLTFRSWYLFSASKSSSWKTHFSPDWRTRFWSRTSDWSPRLKKLNSTSSGRENSQLVRVQSYDYYVVTFDKSESEPKLKVTL